MSAAAVILTTVHLPDHPLTIALSWRPLRALGLISYGVYLWHWPVDVVMTAERVGLTGWPLIGVQSAITLALSIASYRWIEQPIRRGWGTGRTWRRASPALAGALVAVTLISTAGVDPGSASDLPAAAAVTHKQLSLQNLRLSQTVGASTPRVLVGGDSLAFALAHGRAHDSRFAVCRRQRRDDRVRSRAGRADRPAVRRPNEHLSTMADGVAPGRRGLPTASHRAPHRDLGRLAARDRRPNGSYVFTRTEPHDRPVAARAAEIAARARVPFVILTMPCLDPTKPARDRIGEGIEQPRPSNGSTACFVRSRVDTGNPPHRPPRPGPAVNRHRRSSTASTTPRAGRSPRGGGSRPRSAS